MRTAFVTGGTGFLGLNLIEQLVAADWRVTVLHRCGSDTQRLLRFPVTAVTGDITDPPSLRRAIPEGVDVVFHLAANTTMWSREARHQMRDNVEGTANTAAAARATGARRFVYTSSWNAWGWVLGPAVLNEDRPQRGLESPVSYDRSKALAEAEVRMAITAGLHAVILNPAHIIGRYDTRNWARLITLVHRRRLPGVPPGAGSFCHAAAVARAHIAAAERGRSGQNYLLGGADATFLEVVRVIGELADRAVPRRALPAPLLKAMSHVYAIRGMLSGREPDLTPEGAAVVCARARIDSDKATRELGYETPPLRVMLDDAYGWLEREGLLEER